ncbi:putative btb poz-like protein [Lasiodiplodia theobromae]|nr:putative btb poz-like protein [Lasiodiplodia theobromae]
MPRQCDEYDLSSSFAGNHETKKGLMDHLGSACFSDKFSDMKVRLSNGEEINCHRVIVCGQCQFFDNALKEDRFREGQTGAVDMSNDFPQAVKALLEFCYKGGYTVDTNLDTSDKLLFHVDVMNVAAVYNVEALENVAADMVQSYLQNDWQTVIPILPDVFRIIEQLDSPSRSKWSHNMLSVLLDGALLNADLLLETETWECLWKYAEGFMEEVTRMMKERWGIQGLLADIAHDWLTELLGMEALQVSYRGG